MTQIFHDVTLRFVAMKANIHRELSRAIADAARECMVQARELAPVGTGPRREPRLVDSFSYEAAGLRGEAKVSNPHGAYVEFGTGVRGAQSSGRGANYDDSWPGMAAQPYMHPAAQLARVDFARDMLAAAVRGAMVRNRNGGDGDEKSV